MPAARPPGDESRSEFEQALGDATPLEGRDKVRPTPTTLRRRRRAAPAGEGVTFEVDGIGERIEGRAPGIDRAVLRKLRAGEFERDARVDLHGLSTGEARTLVRETLTSVHREGGRCVLVIHGRGRHSEAGPVLKEQLVDWLEEPPLGGLVMAFSSARGGDGGVGATYVLLRRDR